MSKCRDNTETPPFLKPCKMQDEDLGIQCQSTLSPWQAKCSVCWQRPPLLGTVQSTRSKGGEGLNLLQPRARHWAGGRNTAAIHRSTGSRS